MFVVHRRPRVVLVLALLLPAACGADNSTSEGSSETVGSTVLAETTLAENSPAESTLVETTATMDSTDVTVSGEPALGEQCPPDQPPALAAYDMNTGELRWVTCSAELNRRSVIHVSSDVVYAAEFADTGISARLVAVGARDGAEMWQLEIVPLIPVGPFVGSGVAVVTVDDADGRAVVGVDPATGEIRWRTPLGMADAVAATDTVVVLRSAGPPEDLVPPTFDPAAPLPPVGAVGFYSALDRASGAPQWSVKVVTPLDNAGGYWGATVGGDTVILLPGPVALDANSGAELWQATESLGDGALGPVVDGVMIWGGQDDPTTAIDASTGEVLWTMPGSTVYDDVWAVGDGAVYVVDLATADLIAYELATGAVRWRRSQDIERHSLPWHAAGDTVFAMWANLDVLASTDGSTLWATGYPGAEFPRMTGVGSNDTQVVVSFSSVPSDGD